MADLLGAWVTSTSTAWPTVCVGVITLSSGSAGPPGARTQTRNPQHIDNTHGDARYPQQARTGGTLAGLTQRGGSKKPESRKFSGYGTLI